ncbi:MAG: heterodisulfide reductase-related iron-sulfur binding cluster [Gemmatimonadales bacterium]
MADGYRGLDPCVHCGFCLPACPTYLASGDENESPRGRIVLMQALERGDLSANDRTLAYHLDNCLGCRGCEPACPSGVAYGPALAEARHALYRSNGVAPTVRTLLAVFASKHLWRPLFTMARWLRRTRLPSVLAGPGPIGFGWGMLAGSAGLSLSKATSPDAGAGGISPAPLPSSDGPTVALFRGCVMDTLFPHVHRASRRTLEANGYRVFDVPNQGCCGALHEHAGDSDDARLLAQRNVAAMPGDVDFLAIDSAGCGALMREYGRLLDTGPARRLAESVRDITELLAETGPRQGGPLPWKVVYDAPCHLQHAQGVHQAPLSTLAAIPELEVHLLPGYDRCCGSAGLFSLTRPTLAKTILDEKLSVILAERPAPAAVVTGNPGCLMHIGAGLLAAKTSIPTVHPVELLDASYRLAGYYSRSH